MRQMKWVWASLLLASLAGCATLSEKECRSIDWTELGRSDGARGYESTRLGDHTQACNAYGVNPDIAAYRAGREEGLRQYCTPENAMQLGLSGTSYRQVCAGEAGVVFARIHARGLALRAIKTDMQDLQNRLSAERTAQADVKDLDLYKKFEQNTRYLERENNFMQSQYDQAALAVDSGYDPPFFDEGEWATAIPYPDALHDAGKSIKYGKQ